MDLEEMESHGFRKLKERFKKVSWLDEVGDIDKEGNMPSIESIKNLIASGSQLPPHPRIESEISKLQDRLNKMEAWEKKVNASLEEDSKQKLPYLEALLKEANTIRGFLPSRNLLNKVVKEANNWFSKVHEIKSSLFYPYTQTIEKLATEGRPIPVILDAIREMDILMNTAKLWLDKAETTFLRKHTDYTLLEALCPRTNVGINTFHSRKRRNREDVGASCSPSLVPVDEPLSPENLITRFKNVENNEVELMKTLRRENLAKRVNDNGDAMYCICQKEFSEGMLQCELCKDYFHASCVPVIKVPNRTKQQSTLQQFSAAREKFLCPCCMRSRRPRLDAILPLLVGLQELPLRIPEGEAWQILTERTMNWQDKACQALGTDELSNLLNKLNEAAAREKKEKIISTEPKKAANNPELHCRVQAVSSLSGICEDSHLSQTNSDQNMNQPHEGEEFPELSSGSVELLKDANGSYSSSEHAYSSASKSADNSKGKKHSRKSPLVPRQLETPVLSLSEEGQRTLEELMVEGDLLEISVDEASFIWQILQATRPRKDDRFPEFEEDDSSGKSCSKQRRRKRRPDEGKEVEENKKVKTVKAGSTKRNLTADKIDSNIKKSNDGLKSCEDLSDNDEDCAAEPCRKPKGRKLLWVQCDNCNAWCHIHCVGLKKKDLKRNATFLCPACRENAVKDIKVEPQVCPGINRHSGELYSMAPITGVSLLGVGGPTSGSCCSSISGVPVSSASVMPGPMPSASEVHRYNLRGRKRVNYHSLHHGIPQMKAEPPFIKQEECPKE